MKTVCANMVLAILVLIGGVLTHRAHAADEKPKTGTEVSPITEAIQTEYQIAQRLVLESSTAFQAALKRQQEANLKALAACRTIGQGAQENNQSKRVECDGKTLPVEGLKDK